MSIFQCGHCGCVENSALTMCYHTVGGFSPSSCSPAVQSYREILGLKPEDQFGKYCSACCPVWYDEKGSYGVGKNPHPTNNKHDRGGGGLWHGRFKRMFLPKGEFETGPNGNLRHKITKDENVHKYALNPEDLK